MRPPQRGRKLDVSREVPGQDELGKERTSRAGRSPDRSNSRPSTVPRERVGSQQSPMEPKIRVLVADDSAVSRLLLCHIVDGVDCLHVIGTASDGREAVERVQNDRPDVVLMDINMPHLDGLGATQQIMSETPVPIVVMSAASQDETHANTFQALEAGALAFVAKPRSLNSDDFHSLCRHLTDTLRLMAGVKVVTRLRNRRRQSAAPPPASTPPACSPEVLAIGLSTGGPPVLRDMLETLGPDFPLPVLVAQHISPGFESSLARWLCDGHGLRVVAVTSTTELSPGVCYIAPGGSNMTVVHGRTLRLRPPDDGRGPTPSVNALFASVLRVYGTRAAAALMTGMGSDGAQGLLELRRAGALTLAQREDSCAVYGMPAEAIRLEAARYVLSPVEIARTVRAACKA